MTPAGSSRRFRIPGTFVRYVGVGMLSLAVDVGTLSLLYDVAHQNLVLATSAGFWLSFLVNFLGNKYLTFSTTTGAGRQLRRYLLLVALSYLANVGIVSALVELGLLAVISKLMATALLTVVNFAAYRYWVFAVDPADETGSADTSAGAASSRAGKTQAR